MTRALQFLLLAGAAIGPVSAEPPLSIKPAARSQRRRAASRSVAASTSFQRQP